MSFVQGQVLNSCFSTSSGPFLVFFQKTLEFQEVNSQKLMLFCFQSSTCLDHSIQTRILSSEKTNLKYTSSRLVKNTQQSSKSATRNFGGQRSGGSIRVLQGRFWSFRQHVAVRNEGIKTVKYRVHIRSTTKRVVVATGLSTPPSSDALILESFKARWATCHFHGRYSSKMISRKQQLISQDQYLILKTFIRTLWNICIFCLTLKVMKLLLDTFTAVTNWLILTTLIILYALKHQDSYEKRKHVYHRQIE